MAVLDTSAGKGTELSRIAYVNYIEPQWNTSKVLHNYFGATKKETASVLNTKLSLQMNGNFSISSLADGGSFPAVGSSLYKQLSIPFVHPVGAVGITGQAVDVIRGDASIVAGRDIVAQEMAAASDSFLKTLNILDWGDGTGTLATLVGTGGSHATDATSGNNLGRYLRQGMIVDTYNSGLTTASNTGLIIDSVSPAGVITWHTNAAVTAANDVVVLTGMVNAAPNGVQYQISNSNTYFGLARTSFPILQTYISSEGSADLTLPKLFKLISNVKRISGRFNPKDALFLMHYDQMQVLSEIGYATQRYVGKIGSFDAGINAVSFNDIPAETDDDAPVTEVYLLQKSTFFLVTAGGMDAPNWATGLDGQVWRPTPNTSGDGRGGYKYQYEADLHFYYNIACNAPNRSGKLTALSLPAGYATAWVV